MATSKIKKAMQEHRERQGKEYRRVVLEDDSSQSAETKKDSIWKKFMEVASRRRI